MDRRKITHEADARACLDAVAASGLERAAWARAHGVDARSLNAWRLALARRPPTGFVELVTAPQSPRAYTVQVGVFSVPVPADFEEHSLARLLQVLARC
jgi:hypothetical protein